MDADRPALMPAAVLPRRVRLLLAALPVVWLALFFGWPVVSLVGRVAASLSSPRIAPRTVWFTLWQATASTVVTVALGMVPAYVLSRFEARGRRMALAAATVPFMLPTVVVGTAFLALLPQPLHGSAFAVIAAHVYFNIAVVVRLVGSTWAVIPHSLTGAARTLGASPAQVARHVIAPLLAPSIVAAATVVFLFTFTSYGVVLLLGGPGNPTIEVEIVRLATQAGALERAVMLSAVQVIALAAVVLLSARLQRRATQRLGGAAAHRVPRAAFERRLSSATILITVVVMSLPLAALVVRSIRPGDQWSLAAWRALGERTSERGISTGVDALGAIDMSLRIAVAATAISVTVGMLGSLASSSVRRRRASALDIGLMLPLGTSAVTVGLGMVVGFAHPPLDWRGSWWLIPVGHSLIAVPFVVRTVVPVLRAVPDQQAEAAATLGASPVRAWWWVLVRRLGRPALASVGLAAAISLGEFGATTFLTRVGTDTVPLAIARLAGRAGSMPQAQAAALATMLFIVTALVVVATDRERVR